MLPNSKIVGEVVDNISNYGLKNTIIIDSSTIEP